MTDITRRPGVFARFFGPGPRPEVPPPPGEIPERPTETPPAEPVRPEPVPEGPAPPAPPEAPPPAPAPDIAPPAARHSWWERLTDGMRRSSAQLSGGVAAIFTKRKLDTATLEELEDLLIRADLGVETASRIADTLRAGRHDASLDADGVRAVLAREIEAVLAPHAKPFAIDPARRPHVVLVVGVNGTGKTTTIGKLAAIHARAGRRVVLAAGDTFRAAAIEQLKIWGTRTGAKVLAKETGADAAGLAFEALDAARREGADLLLIDTAGRLQNKAGLMAELEKIIRVLRKLDSTAPHSVLLTLDATTGQNATSQVEIFARVAGVTGLVMTKLDGTARGGILVAVATKFGLPVHFIGVGEGIDDLEPFDARDFTRALVGLPREG